MECAFHALPIDFAFVVHFNIFTNSYLSLLIECSIDLNGTIPAICLLLSTLVHHVTSSIMQIRDHNNKDMRSYMLCATSSQPGLLHLLLELEISKHPPFMGIKHCANKQ